MKCIKCGKTISANSKFCPYCGEKISADCRRKIKENPINKGNGEIQWYYYNNEGQRFGPIPYDIVVKLVNVETIKRDTFVWHEGLDDWCRAESTGLFSSEYQEFLESAGTFVRNKESIRTNRSSVKRNLEENGRKINRSRILLPFILSICAMLCFCLISIPIVRKTKLFNSFFNNKDSVLRTETGGQDAVSDELDIELSDEYVDNELQKNGESEILRYYEYDYYNKDDGTIAINHWNGEEESIMIPSEIDGNLVNEIGNSAFADCINISNIEIPNSVVTIGEDAFRNCDNLSSINIPDSITTIGDNAFFNCVKLTNLEIPVSVIMIGENAFFNCDNLTLTVKNDSFAEHYAMDNKIPYTYKDDIEENSITNNNSLTDFSSISWSSGEIIINDCLIKLPCSLSDFKLTGLYINCQINKNNNGFLANVRIALNPKSLYTNYIAFSSNCASENSGYDDIKSGVITAYNTTVEKPPFQLLIPGGIELGISKIDDAIELYGSPEYEYPLDYVPGVKDAFPDIEMTMCHWTIDNVGTLALAFSNIDRIIKYVQISLL